MESLSNIFNFSVYCSHSVVSDSLGPHGQQHARLPCPSPTPELAQTHVHQVSDAIQPCHPLSSPSPPAINIFQHQGFFSNESVVCIKWPKYWSFSFIISPPNEYAGLFLLGLTGLISLLSKGLSVLQFKSIHFYQTSRSSYFSKLWKLNLN